MDMARLKGVAYLEPGTAIRVEDLEAWEREAGIRVSSGDIVFVRAGRWARRAEYGPWETGRHAAELHASVAPWLRERGIAMLGSDYTNDALPSGVDGVTQPIHQLTIVASPLPRSSAHSSADDRGNGDAFIRQSRSRGRRHRSYPPESLGVHARRGTASR